MALALFPGSFYTSQLCRPFLSWQKLNFFNIILLSPLCVTKYFMVLNDIISFGAIPQVTRDKEDFILPWPNFFPLLTTRPQRKWPSQLRSKLIFTIKTLPLFISLLGILISINKYKKRRKKFHVYKDALILLHIP